MNNGSAASTSTYSVVNAEGDEDTYSVLRDFLNAATQLVAKVSVSSVISNKVDHSTTNVTHPLYERGFCLWPTCEKDCPTFANFLAHLDAAHFPSTRTANESQIQVEIVQMLQWRLLRECQKLEAIKAHLKRKRSANAASTPIFDATLGHRQRRRDGANQQLTTAATGDGEAEIEAHSDSVQYCWTHANEAAGGNHNWKQENDSCRINYATTPTYQQL